ncbi:FUSC family protein [Corynebacterium minutissimum]|uniref:Integral membrane bound transporter domain-containing protein n=1 Tax=Corynebacterium minutissimum TaxID=38301 RepID=A0A376D1R4_9CORY|nr:FUSC family protein [Corynebacterium minutissimum]QRP61534.1 FUSC family protein [Corynebacterium minutissimum]STC80183.1 Uncharacterised protein [Corynebacterium minutissimum]
MEHPLPQRPSALQLFTAYNSSARRWPGALRAALAIIIPGAVAILIGHPDAVLLVSAGAFSVIYGEGHPFRTRRRIILTAGALLTLAATVGSLIDGLVLTALFTVTLAAVGAFMQNALRLPPPGTFFMVMVAGGSTMLRGISPWEVAGWSLAGVAAGYVLGMLPRFWDPHGPETRAVAALEKAADAFEEASDILAKHHQAQSALSTAWQALSDAGIIRGGRIRRPDQASLVHRTLAAQQRIVAHHQQVGGNSDDLSDAPTYVDPDRTTIPHTKPTMRYRIYRAAVGNSHAVVTAEKIALGGLATAFIGLALGLSRPDWGAVSVLLLLQWGPDRVPGTIRGVQRMLGSVLGVCVFALIAWFSPHGWALLLALAACQFCAEILVVKNYALCVIFSTPLALLMGNSSGHLAHTIGQRMAEIGLSVVVAMVMLWLWKPHAQVTNHYRLQTRCLEAMAALLGALLIKTPEEALAQRRDLHYELLSERRSIQSLAANDSTIDPFWQRHTALQTAGYYLLDFCVVNPLSQPSRAELNTLIEKVSEAETGQ